MPEPLFLRVRLDQRDEVVGPTRGAQVAQRFVVDGEDRARRPVLGRHVADRGAVLERHAAHTFAVELDELADHTVLAQYLGHREHEIGRGRPDRQRADELDADDARQQHRERLAEHRGLGLDTADTPTEYTEPVDHRCVRVGTDERVGIHHSRVGPVIGAEHDLGEVFEIDLMTDAAVRREHAQGTEGRLRPPQERVPLSVTRELELRVAYERVGDAGHVGDDRVVDHEVDRDARLDQPRVATEVGHRVAHRREIDDRGHAGEVLHQHPRGHELQLACPCFGRGTRAIGERGDVVGADVGAVFVAEQVLEQDPQRVRERVGIGDHGVEPAHTVGSIADRQIGAGSEAVERHDRKLPALPRPVIPNAARRLARGATVRWPP